MLKRDTSIDLLRGIAITTMVAANAAPTLLIEPHPMVFRLYGTFAAAIFTFLAGMMISFGESKKNYGFMHYFIRGALIVSVGSLLDLFVWKMVPFITYDILFLTGISTPIAYFATKLPSGWNALVGLTVLALGPVCQKVFGYHPGYAQPPLLLFPLSFEDFDSKTFLLKVVNNLFVSGDFPIFPWTGFVLMGVFFGKQRYATLQTRFEPNLKGLALAVGMTLVGAVIWINQADAFSTRLGWSELFYPPTTGYIMVALGIILSLLSVVDYFTPRAGTFVRFLTALGESSLFIYWFHEVVIHYGLHPFIRPQPIQNFVLIYLSLLVGMIWVVSKLNEKKRWFRSFPLPIRFVFNA